MAMLVFQEPSPIVFDGVDKIQINTFDDSGS